MLEESEMSENGYGTDGSTSSTYYDAELACQCKKYTLAEFNEEIDIESKLWGKISLKYIKDKEEGEGALGRVYHAYWPEKEKCVALKVSNLKMGTTNQEHKLSRRMVENEVRILEHFSSLKKEERKYIIYMYGSQEIIIGGVSKMFFVLELGGPSLRTYFYDNIKNAIETKTLDNLVTKIGLCVAKALQQFHKHAIHLDIKSTNFVTTLKQSKNEKEEKEGDPIKDDSKNEEEDDDNVSVIIENEDDDSIKENENDSEDDASIKEIKDDELECKIIDFNTSVLLPSENVDNIKWYANGTRLYKAPEIRQTNKLNEKENKKFNVTNKVDIWAFGLMIYGLWQNANAFYKELLEVENDYELLDVELDKIRFENNNAHLYHLVKVNLKIIFMVTFTIVWINSESGKGMGNS
uniref:Protein kinase domain-containing protein n=1 Tax=Meloidogyne hapla TaxID=6305 RepID=A0A1I8BIV8_MELHA